MAPFCSAEINEFLPQLSFGISGQVVVDARKLLAKEALLATLAAKSAAAGFVLGGIRRNVRNGSMQN